VNTPARLVFVTTDFRPMTGGVADHLHRVADALAGRASVTVASAVPMNGSRWDHAYHLEVLEALPERRLGDRAGDWFAPIRKMRTAAHFLEMRRHATRTIRRLTDSSDRDTLVVIGIWDVAAHFWCEACRRFRVPYALIAYGVELLIPLYGRLPEWRRHDFAAAARVCAVSRATAGLAAERFGLAVPPAIVHPSIGPRPPQIEIDARAEKLRRTLDLETAGSGPVILSVGRLVPRKGFDLVMRSVAWLRRSYPNVRYLIIGHGPERMTLERLAGDLGIASNVRMLGQADEITKWAAYELCDLFAMPNRTLNGADWEGFGIVFLEAAIAGRPAVGGVSGGAADAIVDGETGLLVDPEQGGAVTEAIRQLAADSDLRARLGAAAARRATMQFSPQALADQFWSQVARA
jgi:phosphatidylinositol alpha-1,6-mannosyltransferase